jgi:ankyrin repeat protein
MVLIFSTVKLLLDDGRVYPSVVNRQGNNCVHVSATNGRDCIAKLILNDVRVDLSVVDNNGNNCLHL